MNLTQFNYVKILPLLFCFYGYSCPFLMYNNQRDGNPPKKIGGFWITDLYADAKWPIISYS